MNKFLLRFAVIAVLVLVLLSPLLYEFVKFESENETYASILNERWGLQLPDEQETVNVASTMTWPGEGFDYSIVSFDSGIADYEQFHLITEKERKKVDKDLNSLQVALGDRNKSLDPNYIPDLSKGYFFYKEREEEYKEGEHIWFYYTSDDPPKVYVFELLT